MAQWIRIFSLVFSSSSLFMLGCSPGEILTPMAASFERTAQPLTSPGGMLINPIAIKGVYGGNCKLHKDETWTLRDRKSVV